MLIPSPSTARPPLRALSLQLSLDEFDGVFQLKYGDRSGAGVTLGRSPPANGTVMDEPPVDIVDRYKPLTIEVDHDICDACDAEAQVKAFVYVEMQSGLTLAYCVHHGTEYMTELRIQAKLVVDLRHLAPT